MNLSALNIRSGDDKGTKPAVFFDRVCAFLFDFRADYCKAEGGRYAFELSGKSGGNWVIDFDALTVDDDIGRAELLVKMSGEDFGRFLDGKLDTQAAQADGRFSFVGERNLFANLAAFTKRPPAVLFETN